jgi:hypothetical protein
MHLFTIHEGVNMTTGTIESEVAHQLSTLPAIDWREIDREVFLQQVRRERILLNPHFTSRSARVRAKLLGRIERLVDNRINKITRLDYRLTRRQLLRDIDGREIGIIDCAFEERWSDPIDQQWTAIQKWIAGGCADPLPAIDE